VELVAWRGGPGAKAPFKAELIRGAKAPRLIPKSNGNGNDNGESNDNGEGESNDNDNGKRQRQTTTAKANNNSRSLRDDKQRNLMAKA
jgi:hypothetical protein